MHYQFEATLLGTTVKLTLLEERAELAALFFQQIQALEAKLTVNRPESEMMKVNRAAGVQAVQVSSTVFQLVRYAKQFSIQSQSRFNIAIGSLVKLWKIGFLGTEPPSEEAILAKLSLVDPNLIELDELNQTIFLKKVGMELDLGAIAKGYITDRMVRFLQHHQVQDAMIDLGGNLFALGFLDGKQTPWRIGIQVPFSSTREAIGTLALSQKSCVTSGIYERFFIHHERLYHHILDSKTGYPIDNELLSVTVIAPHSLHADLYSTVLYDAGVEKGLALLKQQDEIQAIFLTKEHQLIVSSPELDFKITNSQFLTFN